MDRARMNYCIGTVRLGMRAAGVAEGDGRSK
jgi:hypothetical protein